MKLEDERAGMLLDWIQRETKRFPGHTALVFQDRSYTYDQLEIITNRLAAYLTKRGIGRGSIVSILIPRCEYMLIAALGVLKSGAAYQPLDFSYPYERLSYMIKDAQSSLVIVSQKMEGMLEGISIEKLYMEEISSLPEENYIIPKIHSEDLFVLLYTSGSTGVPKGCMLTHGNLFSFCKWYVAYYEVNETCRMAEYASFVFDVSMMELFMPLAAGAAVYIIPEEIRTNLQELNGYFEGNHITHTSMTTQIGRQFAEHIENHSLRHLTVAGEALTPLMPPANYQLHNGYGPTEGTILLTIHRVSSYDKKRVPIGKPLDEVELYILDKQKKRVAKGEIGELCAAGPHITKGYLHQPEQTDCVYEANPFSRKKGYERIYHTGDMVRYREDGLLEYLGREDRQVKIRGFRIELPEVEAALKAYPDVFDAVVFAPEIHKEKVLIGYYLADQELNPEKLAAFMKKTKPPYMIPSYFVRLEKIPLNTNGKVDSAKLPLPKFERQRAEYQLAVTKTEKIIAEIYKELLFVTQVDLRDDFFLLGGHSLTAAKLLFRIEQECFCRLSMKQILEHSVLKDLAACVDKARSISILQEKEKEEKLVVLPKREYYPISNAQKRIYAAQQMCKSEDFTYHLPVVLHIYGNPELERMKQTIETLLYRHEILRTSFHIIDGEIMQKIEPVQKEWISAAVNNTFENIMDFVQPFSLEKAPLFRWSFLQKAEETLIFFDWHHMISDGSSIMLFCHEFIELYNGKNLELQKFQYKDFAVWDKKRVWAEEQKEWIERISGDFSAFELLPDRTHKTVKNHKGSMVREILSKEFTEEISLFCKRQGVTEYVLLISVYFLLLHKYSRQNDMIIGTVMAGRNRPELEKMQGIFVNTVPILGHIEPQDSFFEVLERIKEIAGFAYDHQEYPLEELCKDLHTERTPSGNLLFDVLFVMQNFGYELPKLGGFCVELEFAAVDTAMYPLTLETTFVQGQYQLDFEYDMELFDKESIQWLARHYKTLLEHCLQEPSRAVRQLSMLDQEEQKKLLIDFQGARKPVSNKTVLEALAYRAIDHSDKTAVVFGEQMVSYRQLKEQSQRLAAELSQFLDRDSFGVILAERGLEMIFAIWGILEAGGAYVPISPEYPQDRIRFILEDCSPRVMITCKAEFAMEQLAWAKAQGIPVVSLHWQKEGKLVWDIQYDKKENIKKACPDICPEQHACSEQLVCSEQLAYMIYTSGTTGKPKGVMIEHRQLSNLLSVYTDIYGLNDRDCVLQFANFVFDQSVWDIFHILTLGGTLCLIPQEIVKDPERLEEYCNEKGVTVASLTPGFLRVLSSDKMPALRLLDVGGEAPSAELLMEWSENRTVFNTYGPTETTVNAASFVFDRKEQNRNCVPIGKAIGNTQIYILNQEELCGIGVLGELCIAGEGVARGYLHREQLNAKCFVKNPFGKGNMYRSKDLARYLPDGNIEFLGRMDDQVKIRGYRIELGEIEAQMLALPQIEQAVVIVKKTAGDKILCGYYTEKETISVKEVQKWLLEKLPHYMVPSVFIPLKKFPLTINGKLDKQALPEPEFSYHKEYVKPETKTEQEIAMIWEEVLQISPIGVTEDFFELGGDSIKAILIISKLREQGYQSEVSKLMEGKTIQYLAAHISKKQSVYNYKEYREVLPTPIIWQFFQSKLAYPEQYNQSVLLEFKETADLYALKQAVKALISYHGMLRSKVEDKKDRLSIRTMEEMPEVVLPVYHIKNEKERLFLCNDLQKKLCPKDGIMMQICLFTGCEKDMLLIILHHLVVDEVSWNILIEDLSKLYQEAKKKNKELLSALSAKTMSYGEWSSLLKEYAESMEFEKERIYWKRQEETLLSQEKQKLLSFFDKKEKSEHFFISNKSSLSEQVLKPLLLLAEKKYHTRLDAVLLAGLIRAMNTLTGVRKFCFELESHGRGMVHKPVCIDRTVGWFTTVYPLIVNYIEQTEEQIAAVKEALLAVPNNGIGYGLLKRAQGENDFLGGIVFNYLGQSQTFDYGEMIWSDLSTGQEIHPQNGDPNTITFNIRRKRSGLEIECSYDNVFAEDKIVKLIREFKKNLTEIAFTQEKIPVKITPSDLSTPGSISLEEWNLLTKQIHAEEIERICPLTPLQQGMFYHWIADSKKTAYILQDRIALNGVWKPACMQKSLELLMEKYEICRAAFYYKALKQPYQVILRKRIPKLEIVEHGNWKDYLESERERGFDLTEDILFRVLAFPVSENRTELLITQHHIIMDGWSFPILLSDLERYYTLLSEGESLQELIKKVDKEKKSTRGFSDYLHWREMQPLYSGIDYWKDYLKGYEETACIQKPHAIDWESNSETKAETLPLHLQLKEELSEQLRTFVKKHHLTMSLLFETAWGLLLQWENNINDVIFNKTVSGREVEFDGIETMVGLFINTIPVRIKTEDDMTVEELLDKQQKLAMQGMKFEHIALSQILDALPLGNAFVQTLFVYENYYVKEQKQSIFQVETVYEETNYPVTFFVEEKNGIYINLLYNQQCFSCQQMKRLLKRIEFILWQFITQPKQKLKELERIPVRERELILGEFSGSKMSFPKKTVLTLLKEFAFKQPEKTAVIIEQQSITYAQLYTASLAAAEKIGIGGERFVAILAERSLEMIIGIWAALFSGAAYVPIDPSYPLERIRYILDDCKPAAIFTALDSDKTFHDFIKEIELLSNIPVYPLHLEELLSVSVSFKQEWEKTQETEDIKLWDRAAYMIYTSGTTGRPKGVIIEHKSLSNMVYVNASVYHFCESDIVLQMANYVFDQSIWDIFGTLGTGGTLCLIPKEVMESARRIEQYAKEHNITVLMTTTMMLETLNEESIGKLRLVDGGGDTAKHEVFQKWKHADNIVNSYGPTEATVNATAYCYQIGKSGSIPIGRALPNKKVYIMQKEKLCGIGMTGEICIAGLGLARSYLHQEELTDKKFICNPFGEGRLYRTGDLGRYLSDGTIEYKGRMDNQVKIRGFRIELGEIEQCLKEYPGVVSAAVVNFQDSSEHSYLSAYLVGEERIEIKEMQRFLRKRLPDYMIPAFLQQIDYLPLNQSGKLDIHKLEPPKFTMAADYEQPETYFERLLTGLFEEILDLPQVGRNDSFFELGGNSIDLMKLLSILMDYHLSAADIFKYPTPKALGTYLLTDWAAVNTEQNSFLLLKDGDGNKPSFLCVPPSGGMTICYMELFQVFHNTGKIYGMIDRKYQWFAKMSLQELWEQETFKEDTWEETLKSYERELQKVWKNGDILVGYSQGGSAAHWLAKRLEQKGYKVGAVVMLEAVPITEELSEQISKKEILQMLFPMFSENEIPKFPPEEMISIKEVLSEWVYKQFDLPEEKQEEFLHLLLESYLVIDRNITNPLKADGKLHCPIYTVLLEDRIQKEMEISILKINPWKNFTTEECRGYGIPADSKEHLIFLSKYKMEIAECMRKLFEDKQIL